MGWQIVKQPDGRLGVFSSEVDGWIAADLTPEEVIELYRAEEMAHVERTLAKIRRTVQYVLLEEPEKAYGQYARTYAEACRLAERDLDERFNCEAAILPE